MGGLRDYAAAKGRESGTGSSRSRSYAQRELDAYNNGWARCMVDIWMEKIDMLRISDTGKLRASIRELVSTGSVTTIEHRFMMYGLYVAAGVGRGFTHGNGGDLLFMGDGYREAHSSVYGSRPVGADWAQGRMLSPRFKRQKVTRGPRKGEETALTSGRKRTARDWFFKKYYYSLRRLNEENAAFFGAAYQGLVSDFLVRLFEDIDSDKPKIRSNRW